MPSKSKQQQKFMGMVHALKKGDIEPSSVSKSVKDAAKSMSKKDTKDFASTKHKNLPRKVKQEILNKLKEYANKMGRDHLGGDDYTSKKRGGLRDFDGYDNVDYNKDMPMDEAYIVLYSPKKGVKPVATAAYRDKKDAQKWEKNLKREKGGGITMLVQKKMKGIDEAKLKEACWKGYKAVGGKMKNGKQVPNCVPESVNEVGKGSNWAEKYVNDTNLYKKLNWYMKMGKGAEKKIKGKEFVIMSDGSALIWNTKTSDWELYKPKRIDKKTGKPTYESVNEGDTYRVMTRRDIQKGKGLSKSKAKEMVRKNNGWRMVKESVNEGMFSMIDQIRQDSKDVRDFVKNVFKDKEFRKMKDDKEFIKYLKSIYEGTNESKGVPQNYMQGRTSDYHTALRGKNRDYSGGTNFKKKDHGQPDIENEDEDQETNQLSNKQTHVKSDKLKVSEEMGNLSSSERIELYKLYSKAMKAMPGSPNQKKLKVLINKLRKKASLKPLPEYGQRLDLSFIEDEEAKLKGTPKSKDTINRNMD